MKGRIADRTWKQPPDAGKQYRVYIVDDVGARYGEIVCGHPELGATVQELADSWGEQIYYRGHQVKIEPIRTKE